MYSSILQQSRLLFQNHSKMHLFLIHLSKARKYSILLSDKKKGKTKCTMPAALRKPKVALSEGKPCKVLVTVQVNKSFHFIWNTSSVKEEKKTQITWFWNFNSKPRGKKSEEA